jgi:hypothetical protein
MTSSLSNGERERDDDPIPLKHLAKDFDIGVSTLKARIADGTLEATKPGREYRASPNAVREMFRRCLVEPKAPAFTVTRRAVNTSSATAAASYDSAQQTVLQLRNSLRNTLRASTGPRQARGR